MTMIMTLSNHKNQKGEINMSIWLRAEIHFKEDVFIKTKTSPVNIVKSAFKDNGLDCDREYSEAQIKQASRCESVQVWIANPDCYTDITHNTFKYLSKQKDKTRCLRIEIKSHYY